MHAPGSRSAHLQAALDALQAAHSAMKNNIDIGGTGKSGQDARRRTAADRSPRQVFIVV